MEHIIQFAINFDDQTITKIVEEKAAVQIVDDIKEEIKASLPKKWGYNRNSVDYNQIVEKWVAELLESEKDTIINQAIDRIAKSIPRTKAYKEKIEPLLDEVAAEIKRIWDVMNTSYDKFVRTTDPVHERVVQKIFDKMYDKGDIYKGEYSGLYCTPCESFLTESQLVD